MTHGPSGPRSDAGLPPDLQAFLEGMSALVKMDLNRYQKPALMRRLLPRMAREGAQSLTQLLDKALHDPACLARVQGAMTLHVTSMFRDPLFFSEVRRVLPLLTTYPSPRVWVAGCSTGQEVWTYLVLLQQAGLAERCRLYATDLTDAVLDAARAGLIDHSLMPEYEQNHQQSGGQGSLRAYCQWRPEGMRFDPGLLGGVVFGVHNLLSDASFNEFQFVSCRNVLMYFDDAGQQQAHRVLHDSLAPLGCLGLGIGESLLHAPQQQDYDRLSAREPLYRRVR